MSDAVLHMVHMETAPDDLPSLVDPASAGKSTMQRSTAREITRRMLGKHTQNDADYRFGMVLEYVMVSDGKLDEAIDAALAQVDAIDARCKELASTSEASKMAKDCLTTMQSTIKKDRAERDEFFKALNEKVNKLDADMRKRMDAFERKFAAIWNAAPSNSADEA